MNLLSLKSHLKPEMEMNKSMLNPEIEENHLPLNISESVISVLPEISSTVSTMPLIPVQPMDESIESVVIKRYYDRMMVQNKNWLGIMTGPTGSGKSYSALAIAECLDPAFSLERVVFTPQDFMRLFDEDKVRKGQIVIWEEAGVTIGARDFMSRVNKAINYFIQSFRSKNTGVIFTLPTMAMLDNQVRNLAHTIMQPLSIDKENKLAIIKLLEIQHNSVTGDTYQRYIRSLYNGGVYKVNRIAIRIPSAALRHAYEKKKDDFLQKLAKDTLGKLTPEDKGINFEYDQAATKILGNVDKYKNHKGKLTEASLAAEFNIEFKQAKLLMAKYYTLKKQYDDKLMRAAIFPMETPKTFTSV